MSILRMIWTNSDEVFGEKNRNDRQAKRKAQTNLERR
jgi:hypothetical protein